MPTDSVGRTARAGVKWTAFGVAAVRGAQFLASIVLARLLSREEFGVMGMAITVIAVAGALREAGIGTAYVQRESSTGDGPTEAIDTLFGLSLLINVALTVSLLLLAPLAASVYPDSASAVEPILTALALLFLLEPFDSTPRFLLQRSMRFDAIALSEVSGAVANLSTAITAAALGAGTWALVAGYFADKIVATTSLIARSGWRPGLQVSRRMAGDLLGYGKYLWGFALVRSAGGVMDRAVIGRLHGEERLGDYNQAFKLCTLPSTAIAQLVNRVALPAMSRLQGDRTRLGAAFMKSLSHVSFICVPIGIGLIAVSDVLVPAVYGEKWAGMIPIIDVLAVYGIMIAVASVCGPALQALHLPQYFFYTEIARQAALLALVLEFGARGEVAVAWSVLGAFTLVTVPAFILVSRMLRIGALQLGAPLLRCAAASAVMLLVVRWTSASLEGVTSQPVQLIAMVTSGLVTYALSSVIINATLLREFLVTLAEVRRARSS